MMMAMNRSESLRSYGDAKVDELQVQVQDEAWGSQGEASFAERSLYDVNAKAGQAYQATGSEKLRDEWASKDGEEWASTAPLLSRQMSSFSNFGSRTGDVGTSVVVRQISQNSQGSQGSQEEIAASQAPPVLGRFVSDLHSGLHHALSTLSQAISAPSSSNDTSVSMGKSLLPSWSHASSINDLSNNSNAGNLSRGGSLGHFADTFEQYPEPKPFTLETLGNQEESIGPENQNDFDKELSLSGRFDDPPGIYKQIPNPAGPQPEDNRTPTPTKCAYYHKMEPCAEPSAVPKVKHQRLPIVPKRRRSSSGGDFTGDIKRMRVDDISSEKNRYKIALLRHVGECLECPEPKCMRAWKKCAASFTSANNAETSSSSRWTDSGLKMAVKCAIRERPSRSLQKWWSSINYCETLDQVREMIVHELSAPQLKHNGVSGVQRWPLEETAKFLFKHRKPIKGSGGTRNRPTAPNYCSLHLWDPKLRAQITRILLELHQSLYFSEIHELLSNIFTLYDIKLCIIPNCSCQACSKWGLHGLDDNHANAELTRKQCQLVSAVLKEQQRLNITTYEGMRDLHESMKKECKWPLLDNYTWKEFINDFVQCD